MLVAVKAVHDHGIVHCDLKPQNFILFRQRTRGHPEELGTGAPVLFEQYVLKLCDFGVSRQLEASATHVTQNAPIGTVRYMAPEVVHDCRSDCKLCIGKAADIWSIGVVLHQMLHLGLTPHSHVERLKHKLRLMLAIADPKSARVQSSCPRLLISTSSRDGLQQNVSRDSDTAEDNMRLASARHTTLMGLQSACLQYRADRRATTDHLVSATEAEGRRFFSAGLAMPHVPLDAVSHSKEFVDLEAFRSDPTLDDRDRSKSGDRFLERRRQGRFRRLFAWILVCVVGVALSGGLAVMLLSRKNNGDKDNQSPGISPAPGGGGSPRPEPLSGPHPELPPGGGGGPRPEPLSGPHPRPAPGGTGGPPGGIGSVGGGASGAGSVGRPGSVGGAVDTEVVSAPVVTNDPALEQLRAETSAPLQDALAKLVVLPISKRHLHAMETLVLKHMDGPRRACEEALTKFLNDLGEKVADMEDAIAVGGGRTLAGDSGATLASDALADANFRLFAACWSISYVLIQHSAMRFVSFLEVDATPPASFSSEKILLQDSEIMFTLIESVNVHVLRVMIRTMVEIFSGRKRHQFLAVGEHEGPDQITAMYRLGSFTGEAFSSWQLYATAAKIPWRTVEDEKLWHCQLPLLELPILQSSTCAFHQDERVHPESERRRIAQSLDAERRRKAITVFFAAIDSFRKNVPEGPMREQQMMFIKQYVHGRVSYGLHVDVFLEGSLALPADEELHPFMLRLMRNFRAGNWSSPQKTEALTPEDWPSPLKTTEVD